ncbi:MAG: hypothetical protein LBJ48_04995 [Coriobacteriales bacterium]|nr:hypothetical protein [Coriobacteriales bacterium]
MALDKCFFSVQSIAQLDESRSQNRLCACGLAPGHLEKRIRLSFMHFIAAWYSPCLLICRIKLARNDIKQSYQQKRGLFPQIYFSDISRFHKLFHICEKLAAKD